MASGRNGKSVLIIVENLPVPRDRRVWQEAKALHAAGYEVSVICPRTKACPERHLVLDGIHIYRHPLPEADRAIAYPLEYGLALFWEFILAWRVLLTRGFDIIHACNPPDTIFLIGAFFKLFGKKFVFDHHDLCPELFEAKFGNRGLLYKAMLLFERLTFKAADISIATNQSFKKIAIERGGMAPDRVHIVRSGPDMETLKVGQPDPALKKGRKWLVGYVGVMNSQDGVDYVLNAAHWIIRQQQRTDVQFALLGEGPELAKMQRLAADLGVAEHVTFTGWADNAAMASYLSTCDVCVCPDPWNAFNDKLTMNKIVEYMAFGKPVVQFDLTEGRYSAGDAALYANRNDAVDMGRRIVELFDDDALRERLGILGRQRVEANLSWQRQVPLLLDAYASLDIRSPRRRLGGERPAGAP